MPLILVLDPGEGVLERVRAALGPEGWRVARARGVAEAMGKVASEAPDLFLVSTAVEGAADVIEPFARLRGGPGTLALVPETRAGEGSGEAPPAAALGGDGVLREPFTDDDLRAAVAKILHSAERRRPPVQPGAGEPKLTSADIFGELVAEVEREVGGEGFAVPKRPGSTVAPGRSPGAASPRRAAADDEIERKLEQTLSGVLGASRRPASPRPSPPAPAPPPKAAAEKRSEVDELISKTLSGLDLGVGGRRGRPEGAAPAAASTPPPAPSAPPPPKRSEQPFDLSDFEAMIRSRKGVAHRPPAAAPEGERTGPLAPGAPAAEPPGPPEPRDAGEAPAGPAAGEPPGRPPKAPAKEPASGIEFGQYRLLERIGVGGMAEVWKARMTGVEGFQKTVAIKKILPHLTDSPAFVDMFIDEAKLAAQLSHANIIHIYDLGKIGDDYYIAMEYVEGENLRSILNTARERGKPFPVGLALHVAARLASALDHAHRTRDFEDQDLELVHRDVSPQNVLVGFEGTIKLCDFGIVKAVSKSSHTQMGALKGKLQYMSPEQAWGRKVDGRSDIFAVGTLLYEMLTGRRLFAGESEMEVLEAVRECRVSKPSELRPEVGDEVDAVVLKALAKEPGDRFQSAGDLAKSLEDLLAATRPTPGQAELAAYVAELFDRAPEPGAAAPGPGPRLEPPRADLTGTPAPARPSAEAGTGTGGVAAAPPPPSGPAGPEPPALEAVEPVSDMEPEEGGGRGKGLLVAAIVVALVVGALLVWYLLRPGGDAGPAPEPDAQAQAPQSSGGAESAQARSPEEPGAPSPAPAGPEAAPAPDRATGSPPAGAGATATAQKKGEPTETPEVAAAVDRALKERMAEREKELRKQFEAEERRLKDQLDEIQKQKPAPEPQATEAAKPPAKPPAPQPAAAPAPAQPAPTVPAPAAAKGESEAADTETPPKPSSGGSAEQAGTPPASPATTTPAAPSAADTGTAPPAPKPAPPPAPREPAVREGELVSDGPGVVRPQVVSLAKPEYPPMARRLRVQGEVVVSVLVDETGRVIDTRLEKKVSQDVGLNEAALEAARNARFRPATKNGVRVKMWTTIGFPFKL